MALVIHPRPRYPHRMNRPDNPFAVLAASVLPEQTSGRLSRMAGVNQRIAQRWLSGELPPLPEIVQALKKQRELLAAESPERALDEMIGRWQAAGLDDEVIGAVLSVAYERLLARRVR